MLFLLQTQRSPQSHGLWFDVFYGLMGHGLNGQSSIALFLCTQTFFDLRITLSNLYLLREDLQKTSEHLAET